jgi:methionyl-tRNA synthetase
MFSKNFYITTPIYYPSGRPHMGHAYSSIIADIFARFKRIDEYSVMFLTGTDEHGLKMQREAEKKSKDIKLFCDELSSTFKDLTKILNLSNDDFIRTTEKRHYKAVEEIWNRLVKSKDIYLSKYSGWYSVSDEAYYDEDEIETKDNIKCAKTSGSKVEWVEEESYFFKLSRWQDKLLKFYTDNPKFILPLSRRNEVIQFVKKGLKDLSVSRTSFSWGIPVPKNSKHVIYVWLDALTNYLSALNFPNTEDKKYKKFWPATVHIIGKDILRFHAIYWPAFLMAAKVSPPQRVYGHGWILSDEKKMSKSLGNILDPIAMISDYGIDQLRYYLAKEVSLGNDGNISLESLTNCINNDLANNYGNLCQRVFSFVNKNCNSKIPSFGKFQSEDTKLSNEIIKQIPNLKKLMDNQDLNLYIKELINFSFNANKYFNDLEPWSLKKTNPERMNTVLYNILNQIRSISILLHPIIPDSTNKALDILGIKKEDRVISKIANLKFLKSGNIIKKANILFKKIENDN